MTDADAVPEPQPEQQRPPTPPPPPTGDQLVPRGPGTVAPGAVKVRSPVAVIVLSIITLGIYFLYWTYQVFRELKENTGQGVGGPIGLLIGIIIGVVNLF